jgi:hypothetical protein
VIDVIRRTLLGAFAISCLAIGIWGAYLIVDAVRWWGLMGFALAGLAYVVGSAMEGMCSR